MNTTWLKGMRTVAVGLVLLIVPQATAYLAGVDWTHVAGISPNAASVLGALMITLRMITNTAIGQK